MLQRIRTLAVQAANGTNTEKDRKALQEEVDSLCLEITRIGHKTTFAGAHVLMSTGAKNGNNPLDTLKNATGEYFFQVGANANDMISLKMSSGFHMKGIMSMLGIAPAKVETTKMSSRPGKQNGPFHVSCKQILCVEMGCFNP